MADGLTMKLEGFAELDAALAALGPRVHRRVVRTAGKKSLARMRDDAKARAPREHGGLADSITISGKLSPRQRRDARGGRDKADVVTYMGPTSSSQSIAQEFGTAFHPPHPYMRPAWAAGHAALLSSIKTELAEGIAKEAKRLARKAAANA